MDPGAEQLLVNFISNILFHKTNWRAKPFPKRNKLTDRKYDRMITLLDYYVNNFPRKINDLNFEDDEKLYLSLNDFFRFNKIEKED